MYVGKCGCMLGKVWGGGGGGLYFFMPWKLKVSQLLGTLGIWIHVLALQHIPVLALMH